MKRIFASAVLASAACSSAYAQGRWELPSGGGWALPRCVLLHYMFVEFLCGDQTMFLQTNTPMDGKQRCCSPLTFTTTTAVDVEATANFKVCGVGQSVKVKASHSFATTDVYNAHVPCGCVQVYWQQDWRLKKQRNTYRKCYTTGNPNNPWEYTGPSWDVDTTIKDKVPNGGRPMPYYFQNPSGCPDCTNGSPNNPAVPTAPAWDPNTPGGFPAATPNARPEPDAVPWAPGIHGDPTFDAAMAPNGSDKQITIDLRAGWKPREIKSTLALTLWECGYLIQSMAEFTGAPYNAGTHTQVEVLISEDARLVGTMKSITGDLYKYADAMVNAKSYGDFNGDGSRDGADLADLMDHVMTPREINEQRLYDVNGDDEVDQNDVAKWQELVAG